MFHVALKFQYLHTSALPHVLLRWLQPEASSAPAAPASGAPPVVAPARVPVVVVPDEGDSGVPGVSGVSDEKHPNPSPKKSVKPKAMPRSEDSAKPAKPQLKLKAKPKPPPAPPPNYGVYGVAGAKRKNSRSPSAGVKRKTVRLAASASSAAGGNSGGQISSRKPLQGETFVIYSAGKTQASNRDLMNPS